jgi:hypothetical protein
MNIVVFSPYTLITPHFETELEIIQRHLDDGDDVVFLRCNAELLACYFNPDHQVSRCLDCIGKRAAGLSLLSHKIKSESLARLSDANKREIASVKTEFSSLEELKDFTIEDFDIGYAVLSTIIDLVRDPKPDLKANALLVKRFLLSALASYRSVQNYLDAHRVDRMYVYLGRVANARAAFRACQSRHVDCFIHDHGQTIHHYGLYENCLAHDFTYIEEWIRRQWKQADGHPDKERIASQFYIDRAKGVMQNWYSFTKDQKDGLLPTNWNESKKNIAIFNSSEDEFAAIGDEWKNPLYVSQADGVGRMVQALANQEDTHLYLRLHPNLIGVKNDDLRRLISFQAPNFRVISPEDPVSTYGLIKAANVVVTFGSTVGIEAAYWGTPSVLAGMSFYRNLDATYNPRSHEELLELLRADLRPKDREGALMYGYYCSTYGTAFKYFQATDLFEGKYRGTTVRPRRSLLKWLLARSGRRLQWYANRLSIALARKRLTGIFSLEE